MKNTGTSGSTSRKSRLETSLIPSGSNGKRRSSDVSKGLRRSVEAVLKLQKDQETLLDFLNKLRAAEEELSEFALEVDPEVSHISFEEKSCGREVAQGEKHCQISAQQTRDLSSIVVSLALFAGDKMLFACSGIPVPGGTTRLRLTRFVTSARLVDAFNKYRNRDDNLSVAVCLPGNKIIDGFLGLYDNDIAIVTSADINAAPEVGMDPQKKHSDGSILVAGRAFKSCNLMGVDGCLGDLKKRKKEYGYPSNKGLGTFVPSEHCLTEAVLGGPLVGSDEKFLGMITHVLPDSALFLPQDKLYGRLKRFQIINHNVKHFRGYKVPAGAKQIFPSGFMKTIYHLESCGYPMPPPLVLEFNGRLLNHFEERFGDFLAWEGYPFGEPPGGSWQPAWEQLRNHVAQDISRRVVSLASFNGRVRHFACSGLLIEWPGSKSTQAIILTSASLVRKCDKDARKRKRSCEDDIDRNLRIDVFLPPPMQYARGNLEYYDLDYNVAIVSVENFNDTRPEDNFNVKFKPTDKVLAIGRDIQLGLLMASTGEVCRKKACKLDCKDLQVSTCEIKKVGIGGPLINLNGTFAGMNFYDGSKVTPFLPRSKIVEVLNIKKDDPLPSECGHDCPVQIRGEDLGGMTKLNKWPVPEPYWCHGGLDVSMDHLPKHIGRVLQ